MTPTPEIIDPNSIPPRGIFFCTEQQDLIKTLIEQPNYNFSKYTVVTPYDEDLMAFYQYSENSLRKILKETRRTICELMEKNFECRQIFANHLILPVFITLGHPSTR